MMTACWPVRKARFVATPSPEPFWRTLHRLADAAYPDLRDGLVTVLTQAGLDVPLDALTQYLTSGPPGLVITTLEDSWRAGGLPALQRLFADQLPSLVIASAEATAQTAQVVLAFEVADPALLLAVDAYGAERVVAISTTTREAIRAAITTVFETGQNVGQLARAIRGLVGLTPRQAASLVRYSAGLTADGVSPARAETLLARQTQRLIRRRAITIARTETIDAASAGQHLLWQQARTQGLVGPELRRYWVITPDDRLCFLCRAVPGLNPDGVGLDETFQTPLGGVLHPTLHPQCRCAVVLSSTRPEQDI